MGLYESLERNMVWSKGKPHPSPLLPPSEWRIDAFGNVIRNSDYGDRSSEYGWEIDHVHPTGLGGQDIFANKRPLHWRANVGLGAVARALLNPRS